jgi:hypothetical protein
VQGEPGLCATTVGPVLVTEYPESCPLDRRFAPKSSEVIGPIVRLVLEKSNRSVVSRRSQVARGGRFLAKKPEMLEGSIICDSRSPK